MAIGGIMTDWGLYTNALPFQRKNDRHSDSWHSWLSPVPLPLNTNCSFPRPCDRNKRTEVTATQYWITYTKKTQAITWVFLLWCQRESNQWHKDFQSFALPTELWHHLRIKFRTTTFNTPLEVLLPWLRCKGTAFFSFHQIISELFSLFLRISCVFLRFVKKK